MEKHPYQPFISDDATKLIIGSFPPPRLTQRRLEKGDVDFYYGSRENKFWKLLGGAFDATTPKSVQERKNFLKERKFGICDIITRAKRKDKNSAKDADLFECEFLDLARLLKANPQIKTLIYTSGMSGGGVYSFVCQSLRRYRICGEPEIYHLKISKDERKIKINSKEYDVKILYSPSGLAAVKGKKEQWKRLLGE